MNNNNNNIISTIIMIIRMVRPLFFLGVVLTTRVLLRNPCAQRVHRYHTYHIHIIPR